MRCVFCLLFVVYLPGGAKGRHAKTRQNHHLAVFCVATFRVFAPVCHIFAWRGERSPRENPPNCDFSVFSLIQSFAPPVKDTTNRGENAKGRHAKTRQMLTFSCFRMVTFRPATRKYATFHALRFRLLFVVSLPGEAKCRHAKTRQNHHLAGFRVATFRVFAPKTGLYDMAQ